MKAIEIIKESIESHQRWIDYFKRHPEKEFMEKYKSVGDVLFHKERIREYKEAIIAIEQLQIEIKQLKRNLHFSEKIV